MRQGWASNNNVEGLRGFHSLSETFISEGLFAWHHGKDHLERQRWDSHGRKDAAKSPISKGFGIWAT